MQASLDMQSNDIEEEKGKKVAQIQFNNPAYVSYFVF